jgi:hypothetical protein
MKTLHHAAVVAIAFLAFLLFCVPVQAEITLSGDLEIDTNYVTTSVDDADQDTTEYDSSGRIKIVPYVRKESGNLFMEAKAEILAKTTGDVDSDDVWGKIGTSTFDFQIGRFEGWDLFKKSNDILIVEAPNGADRYETNNARGRFGTPGQMAVHILPNDTFNLEVAMVYGHDGDDNKLGLRPVADFKFGNVEFLAGFDYLKTTRQADDDEIDTDQFGYGARVQATFGIATFYLNYAHEVEGGTYWNTTTSEYDDEQDETTNSYGAICDLALGEGTLTLAALYTTWEEEDNDYGKTHNQYYATYAHPLPIDGATIKFGISHATATQETSGDDINSDATGFEVRLNYDF